LRPARALAYEAGLRQRKAARRAGSDVIRRYYTGSIIFTIICLALGAWVGWWLTGTITGVLDTLWIIIVLSVLEVSLSFDNAVVNTTILQELDEKWRKRFLTWGIIIAVFGMRVVFPLAIVAVAAQLGPIEALRLAAGNPVEYERIITSAHIGISGYGGAFLAMVGLKFFFDCDKQVHWIAIVERQLAKLSSVPAVEIALVLAALWGVSTFLELDEAYSFLIAGIGGLLTFVIVDAFNALLQGPKDAHAAVARSGLAAFLYLQVLDASFSFDGVIGAFALSNNLFVIGLGLGIGAMFVRSMTIMLVDRGTLGQYLFLEHGAFWAILALAAIMLASAIDSVHIPETVTGIVGALLIGASFWWSVRHNRKHPDELAPVLPTGEVEPVRRG
jgi:hypothetical protein